MAYQALSTSTSKALSSSLDVGSLFGCCFPIHINKLPFTSRNQVFMLKVGGSPC